jgi:hypothetical protein
MVGRWKTRVPAGITGWRIRSLPGHKVSVLFLNTLDGVPHPRIETLFPGEASFTLDLTGRAAPATAAGPRADGSAGWAVFVNFSAQRLRARPAPRPRPHPSCSGCSC